MYGINIENGEKKKCPHCHAIYAVANDFEILFRNVTLLYSNSKEKRIEIKCKQCKSMVQLDYDSIINKDMRLE
jgi:hypothetical protein